MATEPGILLEERDPPMHADVHSAIDENTGLLERKYTMKRKMALFEVVSILIIITVYFTFVFARKWQFRDDIISALKYSTEYLAEETLGALFWAIVYVGILVSSIIIRQTASKELFMSHCIGHILYHMIRWPVLFMMLANGYDAATSDDAYNNEINSQMIVTAFWLDPIIFLILMLLYTLYMGFTHCY